MSRNDKLFTLIVILVVLITIALSQLIGRKCAIPEDFPDLCHKAQVVGDLILLMDEKHAKVERLLQEDRKMAAAFVEAELAAAWSQLLKESDSSHPDIRELIALSRFRAAGEWEFYERFLKLKYPNWIGN